MPVQRSTADGNWTRIAFLRKKEASLSPATSKVDISPLATSRSMVEATSPTETLDICHTGATGEQEHRELDKANNSSALVVHMTTSRGIHPFKGPVRGSGRNLNDNVRSLWEKIEGLEWLPDQTSQ